MATQKYTTNGDTNNTPTMATQTTHQQWPHKQHNNNGHTNNTTIMVTQKTHQ